jgi:hypothetical protein
LVQVPEENDTDGRRWISAAELAEADRMPPDPTFESDLHLMDGEMTDPWGE